MAYNVTYVPENWDSFQEPERFFSEPDDLTDVIFIVEDKELHLNTVVLSMCSPVFKAMFTSDFREKSARKIPLPGKKYDDMVAFFKQLHPMYCKRTPITADSFEKILPLADEYQAKSVLHACEDYMGDKLSRKITPAALVSYLLLFERHHLKMHREQLITRCVQLDSSTLEATKDYEKLPQELTSGDLVRVGPCMPLDVKSFEIRSDYPILLKNGNATMTTSLRQLDRDVRHHVLPRRRE